MPYLDIGEISRLVKYWFVLIVANVCNNLRITFRCREFVKSVGQGVLVIAGGSLVGLVVNFAYDEEKQSGSVDIWTLMLESFFHTSYFQLTIVTLAFWLVVNKLFVSIHYDSGARCPPPQLAASPDPQHVRSPDPQHGRHVDLPGDLSSTNDPDLQLLFDFVGDEILKTRDDIRAYQDEQLLLLRERIRARCSGKTSRSILPCAIARSSQRMAQPVSHGVTLTAHTKDLVPDLEAAFGSTVTVHGSKILHKRFEIESELSNESMRARLDDLRLQVIESMRLARVIDKDCTFQFGSLAVLKNTDTGFKWWKLRRHLTPEILEIHRSPWKLSDLLTGCAPKWTIKGFNLQKATLKAASANRSEPLRVLHSQKMTTGEDVVLCEESHLLQSQFPIFKDKIYIYASSFVEVEEGTTVRLQSEPISAGRPYLISELQGLVPNPWIMTIIAGLSLLATLGSKQCGAEDVLLPHTVERSLTVQHASNMIILGPDSSQISSLSKLWTILHNFLRVYIFAIIIPKCLLALGLLAHDLFLPLDFDVLGLEETPASASGEDFSSTNSPTSLQYVGQNIECDSLKVEKMDTNIVGKEEEEETTAVADSDQNLNSVDMIEFESNGKRESIREPDYLGDNVPGPTRAITPENCSDISCPTSPLLHEVNVNIKENEEEKVCNNVKVSITEREETEKITIAKEEGRLAEHKHKQDEENEISLLQTAQSSPCNNPARTSSVLDTESADRRQDSPTSVTALSSLSRDGSTKTRTLAVAIEAHSRYKNDPFVYAFDYLVEQKVVVIICLSQLRDEMGHVRCVDVDSFAGVNKKKLEKAVMTQINNANHFLRPFRDKLTQRGVPLEIRVSAGRTSLDILVQEAKALNPHWLVLDRSFSSQKKKIQAALECNLVLMQKAGIYPEILKISRVDNIHEAGEERQQIFYSGTIPRTPSLSPKASGMARLKSFLRRPNSMKESSEVIPGLPDGGRRADEDGPRKDQTVLYADVSPGSRSAYLGKDGHNRTMAQQVPILLSSRNIRASPTVSPTDSTWLSFSSSSSSKRNKALYLDSEIDFSTSSSGSGTSMDESQENVSFRMTPTGMVEYTTIGDSEHVRKQGDDVPSPPTPGPSEDPGNWSDDDMISMGG